MKTKLSLLLNIVLIAVLAFGVFKFFIQGATAPSDDGRISLLVAPSEKDYILDEMRGFLETVQEITEAISQNDMSAIAALSAKAGKFSMADVPPSLITKMPLEFKTLGIETHALFRELAETATNGGNAKKTAASLSELMLNCTACHATYRLDLEARGN